MEYNKKMVNHPSHYQGNGYECIDVIEHNYGPEAAMQWCAITAFKYLYRLGKKDRNIQEMGKVFWYSRKYLDIARRNGYDIDEDILQLLDVDKSRSIIEKGDE